jgi:hypothetical protein
MKSFSHPDFIVSRETAGKLTPAVKRRSTFEGVVKMSEKSVSQIANERREKDHEASRKDLSPNKGKALNPNTNWGRQEQRETSIAKDQLNLGSNRNFGRKHESEDAPEHQPQGGFGYTEDQTERSHSDVDSDSKAGGRKPREVKESSAAERHVQGEPGFVEAGRRSVAVQSRRRETEKVFADRRKKSSVNR